MNKVIISKDELLDAAKKIAYKEGISKISIRRVASACGVSVGTIYNYFPSKSDLVIAVFEEFWKTVFIKEKDEFSHNFNFVDYFEQTYLQFLSNLKTFKANCLQQMSFTDDEDKLKFKQAESKYFEFIKSRLLYILEQDKTISESLWTSDFTKQAFVSFVFSNMMTMLRSYKSDCTYFKLILKKILYA